VSNNSGGSSLAESVAEQKRFQDLLPTVFAPLGCLHMVEKVCAETINPFDKTRHQWLPFCVLAESHICSVKNTNFAALQFRLSVHVGFQYNNVQYHL